MVAQRGHLEIAISKGYLECLKVLVSAGAKVDEELLAVKCAIGRVDFHESCLQYIRSIVGVANKRDEIPKEMQFDQVRLSEIRDFISSKDYEMALDRIRDNVDAVDSIALITSIFEVEQKVITSYQNIAQLLSSSITSVVRKNKKIEFAKLLKLFDALNFGLRRDIIVQLASDSDTVLIAGIELEEYSKVQEKYGKR